MNMRLELQKFIVKDVVFAEKTSFNSGTLSVNKQELETMLEEDIQFSKVEIELVHPGESARIVQVMEAIEPRARKDGSDFPGVLNKTIEFVGNGITDALSGSAVILIDDTGGHLSDRRKPYGNIIDMSGPLAEYTVYSKTHNICITTYPAEGVDVKEPNYKVAIKLAGFKAAVYLASCCKDLTPDEVEVYDLPPLTKIAKDKENLPKVVYIMNLYRYYLKEEFSIYGRMYSWTPSMLLHPNELFDGAVINPYLNINGASPATLDTYTIQNHPILKELYERHGKDLLLLGVIPTVAQLEDHDVVSHVNLALKLALHMGADGAILTKATGGSPQIDIAQFAVNATKYGIKSVLLMDDMAAKLPDGKYKVNGIIFTDPKASAMVNTGNITEAVTAQAVERVIGHLKDANGELNYGLTSLFGQGAQMGNTNLVEVKY
ncbi:glycine/sarcosine/betaine reductase component B subunit [Anaeropeptidivorans aminofermentans]|uniref:glycine/sarcosine/betaine reductase component B subunit n=1 Tax=Anaeropeptidivorans aminofermentans TaxID=2934315 RepID=UPI00202446A2|nr:glycine/sarcosine/betaine reductase component B subunit [Anaeropeptidivorans aminofermentans]